MFPLVKIHGGGYYYWKTVVDNFPRGYEEMNYYEGCVGGGSIILNKKPSIVEVINDIHPGLISIYNFLSRNPRLFIELVSSLDYCEETFNLAKRHLLRGFWGNDTNNPDAIEEYVLFRMSRAGRRKEFGWSDRLRRGVPEYLSAWDSALKQLPKIAERLQYVDIRNENCIDILDRLTQFDKPMDHWFVYLDPPFLPETRTAPNVYEYEMTYEEHERLLDTCCRCDFHILLAGYDNPLYSLRLKNWNKVTKEMPNNSSEAKKKTRRTVCLWRNY